MLIGLAIDNSGPDRSWPAACCRELLIGNQQIIDQVRLRKAVLIKKHYKTSTPVYGEFHAAVLGSGDTNVLFRVKNFNFAFINQVAVIQSAIVNNDHVAYFLRNGFQQRL